MEDVIRTKSSADRRQTADPTSSTSWISTSPPSPVTVNWRMLCVFLNGIASSIRSLKVFNPQVQQQRLLRGWSCTIGPDNVMCFDRTAQNQSHTLLINATLSKFSVVFCIVRLQHSRWKLWWYSAFRLRIWLIWVYSPYRILQREYERLFYLAYVFLQL